MHGIAGFASQSCETVVLALECTSENCASSFGIHNAVGNAISGNTLQCSYKC